MRERYFLSDLSLSDVSDLSGLSDLTAFLTVPAALLAPSVMAFSIGVITFWMALPVSWTPLSIFSLVVCSSADDGVTKPAPGRQSSAQANRQIMHCKYDRVMVNSLTRLPDSPPLAMMRPACGKR